MPQPHDSIHRDQQRPFRTPAFLSLLFAALVIAPAAETAAQVCPGTTVATGLRHRSFAQRSNLHPEFRRRTPDPHRWVAFVSQ